MIRAPWLLEGSRYKAPRTDPHDLDLEVRWTLRGWQARTARVRGPWAAGPHGLKGLASSNPQGFEFQGSLLRVMRPNPVSGPTFCSDLLRTLTHLSTIP
ncbi:hypothetical protein CRG98_041124 [Punica granatum]|uniref:Uncharacterized protein n=1 Tax=Punica granatum TaxID=22663 RepID=A0A2I0I3H8_PUNGR|nr:hypothetical protein CRG98_041124 [Punica granatum]